MDKPVRKHNRIEQYNYSQNGAYFITVCTRDRLKILSKISVGTPLPGCPRGSLPVLPGHPGTGVPTVELLWHGDIANRYIRQMGNFYENLSVDQYVIMPDHIHLLISIHGGQEEPKNRISVIARFIGTFKRFCNREISIRYRSCHPERRAKPEAEGSSHRFYCKCNGKCEDPSTPYGRSG